MSEVLVGAHSMGFEIAARLRTQMHVRCKPPRLCMPARPLLSRLALTVLMYLVGARHAQPRTLWPTLTLGAFTLEECGASLSRCEDFFVGVVCCFSI